MSIPPGTDRSASADRRSAVATPYPYASTDSFGQAVHGGHAYEPAPVHGYGQGGEYEHGYAYGYGEFGDRHDHGDAYAQGDAYPSGGDAYGYDTPVTHTPATHAPDGPYGHGPYQRPEFAVGWSIHDTPAHGEPAAQQTNPYVPHQASYASAAPEQAHGHRHSAPAAFHDPYAQSPGPQPPYGQQQAYASVQFTAPADPGPHDVRAPHRTTPTAPGPTGRPPRPPAPSTLLADPDAVTLPAPGTPGSTPPGGRAAAHRAARTGRASRARRATDGPDALRRLLPQALVVAFLAGGTTAFVAHDKAVRLSVDDRPRTLHTFADDVHELLADEGVAVGAHDVVSLSSGGESIEDGDEVTVSHGRPLALTLDGARHRVWTTERTVEAALRRLGVRPEGAYLSAARTTPIARHGLTLDVRTERTVTFMADGREHTLRTNAATVREAVAQAGIVLHGQDTTSVPPGSFPRDGQTVSVLRITGRTEVREEAIPFTTLTRTDPTLFRGTTAVVREGRPGTRRVTYALRTVNGVAKRPRETAAETVRAPLSRVVRVGSRPLPASADADGLDWKALAQCEAGGRPDAVDSSGTYGGLYQFDGRTWHTLGGRGRPQDAPAAEQTYRAKKLYVQRGASPWPVCGRKLHR